MRRRFLLLTFAVPLSAIATNCGSVQPNRLAGTYQVEYPHGVELLVLRDDGSYQQEYGATEHGLTHINDGHWSIRSGGLFDSGQLVLRDAVIVDDSGKRNGPSAKMLWLLPIHNRADGIGLTVNDDLDFEFRRVK